MLSIRPAEISDVPQLTALIRELAEYDRLGYETAVTEEDIARDGFGPRPKFRAILAEWSGQVAGYALFFEFYSTFQGRAGLFLDDIFVRPCNSASRAWAKRCWPTRGRNRRKGRILPASAAKCWTGTTRRSTSIANWAPCRSMSGSRSACWAILYRTLPRGAK